MTIRDDLRDARVSYHSDIGALWIGDEFRQPRIADRYIRAFRQDIVTKFTAGKLEQTLAPIVPAHCRHRVNLIPIAGDHSESVIGGGPVHQFVTKVEAHEVSRLNASLPS